MIMNLVGYSDSSDSSDTDSEQSNYLNINTSQNVQSLKPSLPLSFHSIYTANSKFASGSHLYDGKSRVSAHVEGSWPTHIYLQWIPSDSDYDRLLKIFSYIQHHCLPDYHIHSLIESELKVPQILHVSLSKTLMIPGNKVKLFQDSVENCIKGFNFDFKRIEFDPSHFLILPNENNTRFFVVLVLTGNSQLQVCFFYKE